MNQQEIRSVNSILHLIYHRNKNQHRRAGWWKWLSILKRATLNLNSLDAAAIGVYQQHLAMHIIPQCYLAFSTVVAENQFSALGVVLLSTLARLAKAVGINHELNVRAQLSSRLSAIPAREDRGESVERGDAVAPPRPINAPESMPKTHKKVTQNATIKQSQKKGKQRKKNAIDDLFSGLL